MIQLLIQEYKNGPLIIDATFLSSPPKTSTNRYGFATLEFSFIKDIKRVQKLFQDNPMYHVRLGTADYVIWEGRLEEVQIATDRIDCVAYGYIRAFSDLEVTDLWSNTYFDEFFIIGEDSRASAKSQQYTTEIDDRIYTALQKNTTISGSAFSMVAYAIPVGGERGINTASFIVNLRNLPVINTGIGLNRINPYTGLSSSPGAFPFLVAAIVASGYREAVTVNIVPTSGIALFLQPNTNFTLYIGETGDYAMEVTNFRVGTTPSISGSRLYADEVLKYYASGVSSRNPNQLSTNYDLIESPSFDLLNVIYQQQTGIQVLEDLLARPTNNKKSFELRIWEDQKIIFREKTYERTWYIPYEKVQINKIAGLRVNKVRARYKTIKDKELYTAYITDGNPPYREGSIFVDTTDPSEALEAVQEYLSRSISVTEAKIVVDTVRTPNQNILPSYFVRSGDRIIIIDIPMELYDDINTSFLVGETNYDFSTGLCEIIPEDLTTSLDILIAGK